ncbi:MAG: TetR/AcrR family transcriptional regulator [Eubacteriales bacterium]|nr:TetR/AcrR family transcriptional regulator [Eubacteriales bacterium]
MENQEYSVSASDFIIDALFELMKEQSFEKISITEIAQKAGVSRLSYYRNFQTKEDIILTFFEQEFQQFLYEIKTLDICDISFRKLISVSFSYWEKRQDRIRMLMRDEQIYLIYVSFNKYLSEILKEYQMKFKLSFWQGKFLEGGIMIVLLEWIQNGCKNSPDEMAEELSEKYKIDIL